MVYSYLCARKCGMRAHITVFAHCYTIITNFVLHYEGTLIIKYTRAILQLCRACVSFVS
jgi:hypothetical protein